jgi:hypothetical protein
MKENSPVSYYINSKDEIIFVNDEWSRFAIENGAPELAGESVLGTSIWQHIHDTGVEHLYRQILNRVRAGLEVLIELRCDSPHERRLLEMKVSPRENGAVEFGTRQVWAEKYAQPQTFSRGTERREDVVIVCSWCNKVEIDENNWVEVETAVSIAGLFQIEKLPVLSHGMCGECFKKVADKLKDTGS